VTLETKAVLEGNIMDKDATKTAVGIVQSQSNQSMLASQRGQ
jgi:hypothetical protein